MERLSRRARWSLILLGAILVVTGCRGDDSADKTAPSSEQAAEAQGGDEAAPTSAAQALLQSSGLNLTKGTPLDEAQLKQTGATRQERFTSQDPGLDILLLGYDDPTAAATALPTTASWINRSKTLYKAEAMAEGDYVLLVGLTPGAEPSEESKAVVDKLLNLFIGGASKL